jgi:UDP-N-acetylmuramyl pentapeptide phosphotransferase/UDP-N-acetylglucosamine-1-phosphate transferase
MSTWVWVSTALLAVVLTLGLLWILVNLKKKAGAGAQQPNHRAFFLMGVVMLIAGTAEVLIFLRTDVSYMVALPLLVIGLVFVVIGLVNRDKWRRM